MSLLRKAIWTAIVLVTLVVAASAVFYFAMLPGIARGIVESTLRKAGMDRAAFDLRSVSLSQMRLEKLSLGDPVWAEAHSVSASYGIDVLWTRRIQGLSLAGVNWNWTVRDGKLTIGLPSSSESTGELPHDLPFDRLDLRDAVLSIDNDGVVQTFTASGSLVRTSPIAFVVSLDIAGDPATGLTLGPVTLNAPISHLNLGLVLTEGRIDVTAREGCTLGSDGMELAAADHSARTSPIHLVIDESSSPLMRIGRHGESNGTWLSARVETDGTVQIDTRTMQSFVPSGAANVNVALPRGQAAKVSADVEFANATVKDESAQWLITGITGSIPIDFSGDQVRRGPLTINAVHWRETVLPAINASIGVAGSRAAIDASWNMGAMGSFRIAPVEIDLANPNSPITFSCERVGLEPWLPLLTDSRATGTGSMSGELLMQIAPDQPLGVAFVRGTLSTDPGGGIIQSREASALSTMLDESDPRFASNDQFREIKSRVISALEDFEYDTIRIEFKPVDDRVPFTVDLRGRGRQGPTPQELSLTVNVNDLNAVIQAAMLAKAVRGRLE